MIKTKDGYGKLVGTAYKGSATDLLLSNGGTKAVSDFAPASRGIFFIEGTESTAGTWLGSHSDITEYYKGLTIAYKIPIAGASTTTLNINSLGAKTCYIATSKLTTHYGVGTVVILVYDGTYFRAADYWNSNTYSDCACTTAAATAAKTATSTYYVLRKGNLFTCTIQNTNTAASALTLNINSTGAKAIYLNGAATSSSNYSLSAGKYLVYYDGTNYWFYSDGAKIPRVYGSAESLVVTNCRGTAGSESNSKVWDSTAIDDNKLKVWDIYDDGGPTTYGNILEINGRTNHWKPQIWFDSGTGQMRVRNRDYNSTTWNAWRVVLDGSNYTSYTVKKDGTGASGTWGINITGSAGSVPWTGVSGRPTKLSEFTNDSGFITIDHNHDSRYLQKVTYEWNKELALGSAHTGKVCIGKFPMYDSNIVINVSSTTNKSFHGTLVIATQNINTSGGGTKNCVVYGDATNEFTSSIKIKYVSGSNVFSVYCDFPKWSKNLVHIKAMALAGTPTDIVTAIDAIPSDATILPTNALVTNFAAKSHTHDYAASDHNHNGVYAPISHTHTKEQITDFSHNHDSEYLKKSGGQLNTGATLTFNTYGTRLLTISGNSISADMSADTGTWAGAFATVKSTKETTTMLGWYGSYSGGLTHIFMGGTYDNPAMKMTPAGVFTFANTIQGNISGSAGSVHWDNVTNKPTSFTPSSHTHTYIAALDTYAFDATALPNTFALGASCGFVTAGSGFGSYGSVLTVRTYSGGGGTLQLYTPYSPTYGGTRLKARFGNYDTSSGNSWTDLKELAWTTDIPTKVSQLENDSSFITIDHTHSYLPLTGGTLSGPIEISVGEKNNEYNEGVRITCGTNNWAGITFGSTGLKGAPTNGWFAALNPSDQFVILPDTSSGKGLILNKNGNMTWRDKRVLTVSDDYTKVEVSGNSGTLATDVKNKMVADPHKVVFNRGTIWYYAENLTSSTYYYTSQNVVYTDNEIQKHCLSINPTSGAWTYNLYTYSPTESDTLAPVTGRGNTTTTGISVGGLTTGGSVKIGDCTLSYDTTNKYLRFTFS